MTIYNKIFSKTQMHEVLRGTLARQRPMMSLIEREILAASDDIVLDTANWVTMWVDTGHAVSFDRGVTTAYRGIDTEGRLMWLVRHARKSHGYHSLASDPLDAVTEAEAAWAGRRAVRQRWDEVEEIARKLRRGSLRFRVTRADAARSPLCAVGIEGFLRRNGLGRVDGISGRTAAILMKMEPQLGFVIDAAYTRLLATGEIDLPQVRPAVAA